MNSKIKAIEEEIRKIPYHKGTEHHIGYLRARLAKLKRQEQFKKKKEKGRGFALKKSGDATVVLIGPPSVGKSSLLNKLTSAHARIEVWPFTTLTVIPGMLEYQGAKIQIFDLPGIIGGAARGIGQGKEVLSVAQGADLLILMVDVKTKNQVKAILKELQEMEISLPVLVVVNKIDLITKKDFNPNWIRISALKNIGLEELKRAIWRELRLIRIYLKPKGGKPDLTNPLIMKGGQKVADVAKRILPLERAIKKVYLWGPHARFPGQQISLSKEVKDKDIMSFDT